jgi:hypothetical protein
MTELDGTIHSLTRLVEILLDDPGNDITDVEYVDALQSVQYGLARIKVAAILSQARSKGTP